MKLKMEDVQPTLWSNLIPKKVLIFAWRVQRERIPVLCNLVNRGIDVPSILCPRCMESQELVLHAILTCKSLNKVWSLFFKWWNVNAGRISSLADVDIDITNSLNPSIRKV